MTRAASFLLVIFVLLSVCAFAQTSTPLLLQTPAISKTDIAFSYAGDIWTVSRDGGLARLLTSGPGTKTTPAFSPDGQWIAYTGDYEGNVDVYVMPATGGVPHRLTHHPSIDEVVGWSPDSKRILFRSGRNSYSRFNRLFTVSIEGGLPTELPLPMAEDGSFSPDGSHIAYVPVNNSRRLSAIAWKRYRGGKASRIWIANLADSSIQVVPRDSSNDSNPMWINDRVYFVSDRNDGRAMLFCYDLRSKDLKPVLTTDSDIKSASATSDAIVFEQFGSIHIYDLTSGKEHAVPIRVNSDLPNARRQMKNVSHEISTASLSPSGARAVFESHGEIFTAPKEKGDVRDLTNTAGVAERDPSWSPNGKWIAYFSDEGGEYALHLRTPDGMGEVTKISLEKQPSFYYKPVWSPDSTRISYTDKRLNLWYVDVTKRTPVKIDTDLYDTPERSIDQTWSPDSHWIAYTKRLPSFLHAVFIYSIEQGKSYQVTDGLSDARHPVFDKDGKYLYFLASTNDGPTTGWLDLSSFNRPVTQSAYLIVLRKDLPTPLAPESDEEKVTDEKTADNKSSRNGKDAAQDKPAESDKQESEAPSDEDAAAKDAKAAPKKPASVQIDFENIDQRIVAIPVPARNYSDLKAGKEGTIFLVEAPALRDPEATTLNVTRFDLKSRKPKKIVDTIHDFDISFDGKMMLYSKGKEGDLDWYIAEAAPVAGAMPASDGKETAALKLDRMEMLVDPPAEWKQMYEEVWRIERDFFYDPRLHGLDLQATSAQYKPYLEGIGSRYDLNYLFSEMLGGITVGHLYIRTAPDTAAQKVKTGLLGADYTIENGRYRFSRIYFGENWNPELRAPLTQPGVNVKQGDYLLAVNGRELKGSDEVFEFFQGTAGKSVVLKVGSDPTGKNARSVTVVPIPNETSLRNRAWIDENRRKVDQLSGGKLAYVYLPDTYEGGYTSFNRYYFAQVGRQGSVIDERFNGGGAAADYIIDNLRRPLMNYWMTREGSDFTTPVGSIFGPKAMIINMYAGSGGDALPWYFREAKLGPLVGTRTWGGLVGIYDYPQLMDGGMVTAPRVAFYSPKGEWDVENHGVPPDVEVELDPQSWRNGHDPQLEKAIDLVMRDLQQHPLPTAKRPAFPNYQMKTATQPTTQAPAK